MTTSLRRLVDKVLAPYILSKRAKRYRGYVKEFGYSVKECNCAEEGFLAGAQFAIVELTKDATIDEVKVDFTYRQVSIWNTALFEAVRKAKLASTLYKVEEIEPVIKELEKLKIVN